MARIVSGQGVTLIFQRAVVLRVERCSMNSAIKAGGRDEEGVIFSLDFFFFEYFVRSNFLLPHLCGNL